MNKTYLIIIFLVIVIIFCVCGYFFVNQSNKKVIENFYSTSQATGKNIATINVDEDSTHYKIDVVLDQTEEEGITSQHVLVPIKSLFKLSLCKLIDEDLDCSVEETQILNDNPDIVIRTEMLTHNNHEIDTTNKTTNIQLQIFIPNNNLYGIEEDTNVDPLSNVFLFYENIDSQDLNVIVDAVTEEDSQGNTSLRIEINISGGDIIIDKNKSSYVHVIYLENKLDESDAPDPGGAGGAGGAVGAGDAGDAGGNPNVSSSAASSSESCKYVDTKLSILYSQDAPVKTLAKDELCENSCSAVSPKGFDSNHLYLNCFNDGELIENICNFTGENLNFGQHRDTIHNCTYDSSCQLSYNTNTNSFKCENLADVSEGVDGKQLLFSIHIDSANISDEGVSLEFNDDNLIVNDEIIKTINNAEGNETDTTKSISLEALFQENILFNTSYIYSSNGLYETMEFDPGNFLIELNKNDLSIKIKAKSGVSDKRIPTFTIFGYEIPEPKPTTTPVPTTTPIPTTTPLPTTMPIPPIPTTTKSEEEKEQEENANEFENIQASCPAFPDSCSIIDGALDCPCTTQVNENEGTETTSPAGGDNFVGSRIIEDFSNPTQKINNDPSGVDYSWGANFN